MASKPARSVIYVSPRQHSEFRRLLRRSGLRPRPFFDQVLLMLRAHFGADNQAKQRIRAAG